MEFFLQIRIVYRHILFLYIFLYRKKERKKERDVRRLFTDVCTTSPNRAYWIDCCVYDVPRLCRFASLSLSTCVKKKKVVQVLLSPPVGRGGGRETFLLVRADGEPYSMLYTSRKMYILYIFSFFLNSLSILCVRLFISFFSHRDVFFFFLTSIGVHGGKNGRCCSTQFSFLLSRRFLYY
jgi:hypothetical protein